MAKKEKKYYCIAGEFQFRGSNQRMKMLIEDEFTEQERHLQAHTRKQATFLFAERFGKKFGRQVYIGDAEIFEVRPPKR